MEGKLFCIGTDGKRDKKTKVIIEKEVNNNVIESRAEVTEEHIVYTDPFNYISHSVIDEGCGDGHNLGKDLVDAGGGGFLGWKAFFLAAKSTF